MKLVFCGLCVLTLAVVVAGLIALLSAGALSGNDALTRETLAFNLVSIGSKFTIVLALVCALYGVQLGQWRWVIALGVGALVTLFSGVLSALTNTGPAIYILAPLVTSALALVFMARAPTLTPAHAWWKGGRSNV